MSGHVAAAKQTILVTGAFSQIGHFLLPKLIDEFSVISISRKSQLPRHTAEKVIKLDCLTADAKDISQLPELFAVIHLAPLFLLPNLLDVLVENLPRRIIAFSSTSIYGKKDSADPNEQKLINQLAQAEKQLIERCNAAQINWTIFRPTLIYGANQDKNISLIKKIIEKYHMFPIVGEGQGLRQPVHANDLATACLLALHNTNAFNKSYNLSGGETLTYTEMVKRVFYSLNKKVIILKIPLPVYRLLIRLLRTFPKYQFLSTEMAVRMNTDLNFSHQKARDDFDYQPVPFTLKSFAADQNAS